MKTNVRKQLGCAAAMLIAMLVAGFSQADDTQGRPLPRLKVSHSGRYLVTDQGDPFFWLGDTAWSLHTISPADVDRYLANRAGLRFNVIQVHPGYGSSDWGGKDYAGEKPFLDNDTDRPNEKFWRNIDAIIAKAQAHGLYVALVPMWGEEYGKAFGADTTKAHRYTQWLGKRYADRTNVLWIVSGEYDSINDYRGTINAEQKSVFEAAARGLRDAHHGLQLMTVHPGVAYTSSHDFHSSPWLDFNMLQSGHIIDLQGHKLAENYELIAHDYKLTPTKPVLDGEPFYEDTLDAIWQDKNYSAPRGGADVVRRKAYWSVFSGAFGHTYGHNDVCILFEPTHAGEIRQGSGQRASWKASLDAPGAKQMQHVRALIESRPILGRVPDQSLVVQSSQKGLKHVAACRAADGSYAMLYCPIGQTIKVDLNKVAGGTVVAWWFDPRTGEAQEGGQFISKYATDFTPPSHGADSDWVLVLDDSSRRFPRPGQPIRQAKDQ